uniref:Uncharacterized protein n=1 Tax=Arundo donax TaxID=35708 RepID=A0A0A9DA64_ARUDO
MVKPIGPFFPYHHKGGCILGHPCLHSSLGDPCGESSLGCPCRDGSPEAPCTEGSPVAPCRKSTWEVETCGSHCHNTHHDYHSLYGISRGLYARTDDQDSFQELGSLDDLGVTETIDTALEVRLKTIKQHEEKVSFWIM